MSDFGKGYSYCLGMFLAHAERKSFQEDDDSLWYNGAADHLYEMQIPEFLSDEQKQEALAFKELMIHYRLKYEIPKSERYKHLETAKRLLMEYDQACGINVEKATWT